MAASRAEASAFALLLEDMMPTNFSFASNSLAGATYLSRAVFTDGPGRGVDNPRHDSAAALGLSIDPRDDVDVFAITLVAGQAYVFDIDNGAGGSNPIDLQLDLINSRGEGVTSSDPAGAADPFLIIRPLETGIYFVAVHQSQNDYVDRGFRFQDDGRDTGDYAFNVSSPSLPTLTALTDASDARAYSDTSQRVLALDGNDLLNMRGGNDIASGGDGNDRILGGSGADELVGGGGSDRLQGQGGADALVGGSGIDLLYGGAGNDDLRGEIGDDLLVGDSGRDRLWGDAGADSLFGGADNDFIRGGAGVDRLFGGSGQDTFHFLRNEAPASGAAVQDRVEDFFEGDRIDLSDLILGELTWRGSGAFTDANQVRAVVLTNGYVDLRVNLDRDQASELEVLIDLEGGNSLGRDDLDL